MPLVHTIGHSTRAPEEFVALLEAHAIELLADVRTVPGSRFNPQFNADTLASVLSAAGIRYWHVAGLGGLRKTTPSSPNMGWRNASFRGFADHMLTEAFRIALEQLVESASRERTAIMCAEAVPWRCHRSLIADALVVGGHRVEHIIGASGSRPHALTSFLHVDGGRITYPPVPVQAVAPESLDGRP